jgi:hypothetical protein
MNWFIKHHDYFSQILNYFLKVLKLKHFNKSWVSDLRFDSNKIPSFLLLIFIWFFFPQENLEGLELNRTQTPGSCNCKFIRPKHRNVFGDRKETDLEVLSENERTKYIFMSEQIIIWKIHKKTLNKRGKIQVLGNNSKKVKIIGLKSRLNQRYRI